MTDTGSSTFDIVMLGTFGVWKRGTLQSRALPYAQSLSESNGLRCAILTTPWDDPTAAGTSELVGSVTVVNTRQTRSHSAPLAVAEQVRQLRRWNPRIVHVMKPKGFGALAAITAGRLTCEFSLVVDHDDWDGDGGWNDAANYDVISRRLFAHQEAQMIRRADHVTAASTLLVERSRRIRGSDSGDDVTFLPNGLDSTWLGALGSQRGAHPHHESRSILLYSRFAEFTATWLSSFCGHLDTLLASGAYLDLVGESGVAVRQLGPFRRLKVRDNGYVPKLLLPEILGRSTIAVYPYQDTLINRSKQSVKLLELMAAGCPIVASDVGDIQRIAGPAVELSPSTCPREFAATAARLMETDRRRRELSQCAVTRANEFNIDRLSGRLLAAYRAAGATL